MPEKQPKIGRPTVDPEKKKTVNFNAKLLPATMDKLNTVIARRSVLDGKKYSGAKFIEESLERPLPRKPTAKQIAEYNAAHPNAPYAPPGE